MLNCCRLNDFDAAFFSSNTQKQHQKCRQWNRIQRTMRMKRSGRPTENSVNWKTNNLISAIANCLHDSTTSQQTSTASSERKITNRSETRKKKKTKKNEKEKWKKPKRKRKHSPRTISFPNSCFDYMLFQLFHRRQRCRRLNDERWESRTDFDDDFFSTFFFSSLSSAMNSFFCDCLSSRIIEIPF